MLFKYIVVKYQFEALHSWNTCDIEEVSFLKHLHRHIFHVKVKIKITQNDREKEFFVVKNHLRKVINSILVRTTFHDIMPVINLPVKSCESMAEVILEKLSLIYPNEVFYVSVLEDNENGAEVYYHAGEL